MLVKVCQRCGKVIPYGTQCPSCPPREWKQRPEAARAYNAKRSRKYLNFYKCKAWKGLSARKLSHEKHRCQGEGCKAIATEVHHVVPIQTDEGWGKRYDWDNLEALCVRCHNKRHDRF